MKFIYFLTLPLFIFSKSIQDPVARHDTYQCATYLCPEVHLYANEYITNGCENDFKDFIVQKIKNESSNNDLSNELLLISSDQNQNEYVSIETFMTLQFLTFILSSFTGFSIAKFRNDQIN